MIHFIAWRFKVGKYLLIVLTEDRYSLSAGISKIPGVD
jgi:hypothetical protein